MPNYGRGIGYTPNSLVNYELNGQHTPYPRWAAASTVTLTSQSMRVSYYTAPSSLLVTSVKTYTGSTAAAATPTLCRIGLYSVGSDGGLTGLLASTANDTTLWATTHTKYTKAFSAQYQLTAGTRYAIGVLCVTGATAPTLPACNTSSAGTAGDLPVFATAIGSQSDLPASVAIGSLAFSTTPPYFELV